VVQATVSSLRRSLEKYYALFPKDPVQISIPERTYVPTFTSIKLRRDAADQHPQGPIQGDGLSKAAFELFIEDSITAEQIESAFTALADFYRACGGCGLQLEFEKQFADVTERIDA
jgi:hypothetical protein